MNAWRKPPEGRLTENFTWGEAVCKCCGRIPDADTVRETAEWLEEIRRTLGGDPIHVNSWCRCPSRNKAVGGATGSFHKLGLAVDITCKYIRPSDVQDILRDLPGGLGAYAGFTHVDRGPRRRW